MMAPVSAAAGFMKHADRRPDACIDLDPDDVDVALHLACHDFGRITKGMPVEAQVFEAWSTARGVKSVSKMPFSSQQLLRRIIARFPGIRPAPYSQQVELGRKALNVALNDKGLVTEIKRDVAALRQELAQAGRTKG